jgi:hypothetical protein
MKFLEEQSKIDGIFVTNTTGKPRKMPMNFNLPNSVDILNSSQNIHI